MGQFVIQDEFPVIYSFASNGSVQVDPEDEIQQRTKQFFEVGRFGEVEVVEERIELLVLRKRNELAQIVDFLEVIVVEIDQLFRKVAARLRNLHQVHDCKAVVRVVVADFLERRLLEEGGRVALQIGSPDLVFLGRLLRILSLTSDQEKLLQLVLLRVILELLIENVHVFRIQIFCLKQSMELAVSALAEDVLSQSGHFFK